MSLNNQPHKIEPMLKEVDDAFKYIQRLVYDNLDNNGLDPFVYYSQNPFVIQRTIFSMLYCIAKEVEDNPDLTLKEFFDNKIAIKIDNPIKTNAHYEKLMKAIAALNPQPSPSPQSPFPPPKKPSNVGYT